MQPIRFIFLCFFLAALPFYVSAEIYRWVDEDGKVHYGDKPATNNETQANLETVSINDRFTVGAVERQRPIPYEGDTKSHPVSIDYLKFKDFDDNEDVLIGNTSYGIGCGKNKPRYLKPKELQVDARVKDIIRDIFRESGYEANARSGSFGGAYLLQGTVQRINTDACVVYKKAESANRKYQYKLSQYIKIHWELRDDIQDIVLYSGETEGKFDGSDFRPTDDLDNYFFEKPMHYAVENLLADPEFVKHLETKDLAQLSNVTAQTDVSVNYVLGKGKSSFNKEVNKINASAVTIKTDNGHGSGVIISNDGYVLTNAHVLGKQNQAQILINGLLLQAKLVNRNNVRDVALLKIDSESDFIFSKISAAIPEVGDELYVIGTPLDISLNNSITKGILSAKRINTGLEYFQTDASINPGNSGGPVYNERGELVALTVAGVFTQGGASLNVNYLIPIKDAFKKLNIEETSIASDAVSEAVSDFVSPEQMEKLEKVYESVIDLFN